MEPVKISEIITFFKTGETIKAIELLQKYHNKLLYSTAYGVCQNEEDCKDIVQNVLIKLSKLSIEKFPNSGEMTWLYTMIRHEAIDYIKYEKHHADLSEADGVAKTDQNINDLFDLESYESMIASLNEKQKEVVTMKVLGEFSHKEIAAILGKPIGTIQWIYNTSIGKLRVQLATMMTLFIASIMGILYSGIRKIGRNMDNAGTSFDSEIYGDTESAEDSVEQSVEQDSATPSVESDTAVDMEATEDVETEDIETQDTETEGSIVEDLTDSTTTDESIQVLPPIIKEEFSAPIDAILLSCTILFITSITGIIYFFKKNK